MPAIHFGDGLTADALAAAAQAAATPAGAATGSGSPPSSQQSQSVPVLLARAAQRHVEAAVAAGRLREERERSGVRWSGGDASLLALYDALARHAGGLLEALRGHANVITADLLVSLLPPSLSLPAINLAGLATFTCTSVRACVCGRARAWPPLGTPPHSPPPPPHRRRHWQCCGAWAAHARRWTCQTRRWTWPP